MAEKQTPGQILSRTRLAPEGITKYLSIHVKILYQMKMADSKKMKVSHCHDYHFVPKNRCGFSASNHTG